MTKLTHIIQDTYYRYDPTEFFPIFRDGELANTREFHFYKLRRGYSRVMKAITRPSPTTNKLG